MEVLAAPPAIAPAARLVHILLKFVRLAVASGADGTLFSYGELFDW
jgi:hypothetical protein